MSRRFLLSCFACDPRAGSEPYVGWHWARRVHAGHARIVLTRRHHRAALAPHAGDGLEFRFFDLPFLAGLDHRHRLMKLYYILWQIAVLPYAAWIVRRERITDIHHVTYNAVDFPGLLWAIPGPRFLWGPAGGGQTPPRALAAFYGAGWRRQVWRARMKAGLRFNPFVRLALARATLVLAANAETEARLAPLARSGRVRRMLETAIDPPAATPRQARDPLRVLWVGRFEPRKAPGLLLGVARALSIARPGDFAFTMIGAGPLLAEIRAAALDIPGLAVRGEIPFAAIGDVYAAADVLAFTSLQDTSGNVVLEALAAGIPVVALDHQGAAEILPPGGGLLVPVGPPEAVIGGFAEALIRLTDAETYAAASRAALANIRAHHTWDSRAARFAGLIDAASPAQPSAKSARAMP
ncbi:glycosyltransferase family 4 protein [Amaricoccus solimangrovi]|uniref:Glycosyltransferase family 4 protein n=1 Tax=Amaricoccus solimangrovi TaxID=2589815 RepID=A0A501WSB8_9RHOB|nr:glycosyltransferase family 4 protein [Amaricoccus solimangrovi]TPE49901.1 glycosyltransferase family 4 protein [Amaricoccus solimangrovi]